MNKEILSDLLKKYLRGESTPEETEIVDNWYASLQENPDDVSLLDPLELDIVQNKIFHRIKGNISFGKKKEDLTTIASTLFYFKTPF